MKLANVELGYDGDARAYVTISANGLGHDGALKALADELERRASEIRRTILLGVQSADRCRARWRAGLVGDGPPDGARCTKPTGHGGLHEFKPKPMYPQPGYGCTNDCTPEDPCHVRKCWCGALDHDSVDHANRD